MNEPLDLANDPSAEAQQRADARANPQFQNALAWRDEIESCRPPDSRGDVEGREWMPRTVAAREVDSEGRVVRLVLTPPGGAG